MVLVRAGVGRRRARNGMLLCALVCLVVQLPTFTAPGDRHGGSKVVRRAAQKDAEGFQGFGLHGAALTASSAVLGPALDGTAHGNFGVLAYHFPPPVPVMLGSYKLFSTAIWVPPLFAFAGLLISSLYWLIDNALAVKAEQRSPSLLQTLAAVMCFAANYWASGFMSSNDLGTGKTVQRLISCVLALWAISAWRVFDGTTTGLVVSVMTAVGGTLIEVFLINAPWWDLYAYSKADFWGVDSWIPWVYFCGAPAVGNLSRLIRNRLA
ncbi:INSIG2 [Symbiodinium natans]|uniref:INSIG2 protein n=1 Tax=Symbiodinium natans TaxID=878477 RepID=A0A812QHN9_9DINO|nr:INSIG2 [Symbiodinium natans]